LNDRDSSGFFDLCTRHYLFGDRVLLGQYDNFTEKLFFVADDVDIIIVRQCRLWVMRGVVGGLYR